MNEEPLIDRSVNAQFSTRDQLNKYFRHKWLFLISFILCMAAAYIFMKIATPQYAIYASIVIKDEKKGEPSDFPFRDIDVFEDRNTVDNESEIIRSKTIVAAVIRKMGLNKNYYYSKYFIKKIPLGYNSPVSIQIKDQTNALYESPLKIKLIDTLSYELVNYRKIFRYGELVEIPEGKFVFLKTSHYGSYQHNSIEVEIKSVEETAQLIRSRISVAQTSKNASMLNLAFLHPVPDQGVDILNSIIDEYNKSNLRYREEQTAVTVDIIQQRLNLLGGQLDTIENTEQHYKSRMGITELSADARVFLDRAKESDNNITEAQIKMEALQSIEQYALSAAASPMPPTAGLNDPVLLNLLTKINELELERSEIASTVGSEHASVKIKNSQIEDVRKSILENIALQKQNIKSALQRMTEEKSKIEAGIKNVPLNERNLMRIVREKNIHENIYNYLLQKREEANISAASEYSKLRIVDPSFSSVKPVRPDRAITLLTALLIAIAFPIVLVNVRGAFSKRIVDPDALGSVSAQLIGEISWDSKARRTAFMQNGHSFVSEQFRMLITRLKSEEQDCQTILVTSSEPAEGKSFVSAHLAEVLATWGKKAILIDADLRKGSMSKNMPFKPDMPGLSDYLADETKSVEDIIFPYKENGNSVDLISAGGPYADVFRLLATNRLMQLFAWLRENYEFVIINTPPVRLVSDALLLAKHADVTLYVVRNNYTRKSNLPFISRLHKKASLGKMYLVLNDSPDQTLHMAKKYKEYFDIRP